MAAPLLRPQRERNARPESRRAGAQGARGDKGRDTRSPPPALVPRLSFARGNLPVPPGRPLPRCPPGCPRRSRGASSCSCRISRAGAAAGGHRAGGFPGAAAARASPVPTPVPRPPDPAPRPRRL